MPQRSINQFLIIFGNVGKSYPERDLVQHHLSANSAAVVFGVYLSAQAAFRLDRKSPLVRSNL